MADISALLANAAKTDADFDLGKINRSYWQGRDEYAKNDLRDAFSKGVPTLPDGSIDYGTMQRTLYQKGALEQGNSLSGISARAGELAALNGADGPAPQPAIVSPPSTNRGASVAVAPPLNKGGEVPQSGGSQGQPQPTVMTVLAAQGIPNHQLQAASESIARQLGTDPTAPLDLNDPQVRNVLAPAVAQLKRMRIGEVVQPEAGAPQAAPQVPQQAATPAPLQPTPVQEAAQNDPILKRLTLLSASQDKQIAAAAKVRLEAYLKNKELTTDEKNARAAGKSLEEYQNRQGEEASQLAILKDTVLPELKVSKEGASAARTEIQSMHRAREQLDAPGGIFSGTMAQQRLKLAKAAEFFGVQNTDKITNTEAFVSAMGAKVVASLKALGVNPSNKDLAFAEKMAGSPELNETSLRRILDIGEQAARDKIDRHNTTAGQFIESNEALKPYSKAMRVDAPGPYQRAKGSGQPAASSTFASPDDVHAAIASGKLKKGDTFQDSNGKTRIVP